MSIPMAASCIRRTATRASLITKDKECSAAARTTSRSGRIDQQTGEPTFVEAVDGHGIQLRTFGMHPSGRLLVAASIQPLPVRNGNARRGL